MSYNAYCGTINNEKLNETNAVHAAQLQITHCSTAHASPLTHVMCPETDKKNNKKLMMRKICNQQCMANATSANKYDENIYKKYHRLFNRHLSKYRA